MGGSSHYTYRCVFRKLQYATDAPHNRPRDTLGLPDHAHGGTKLPSHVCCESLAGGRLFHGLGCWFSIAVCTATSVIFTFADPYVLSSCDATPETLVGRQLGIALGGLSAGALIGPPVGGALYSRFGFRGPFIFGMAATVIDLIARLLIIERQDARKWGIDPKRIESSGANEKNNQSAEGTLEPLTVPDASTGLGPQGSREPSHSGSATVAEMSTEEFKSKPLSLPVVILRLSKSSRASAAFLIAFVYG
ncbi:hypothetical protein H0H81_000087 [Sphagnurus paluster]|uniref:Uncharacterized protein n=1 Tax=Sphagnurus paluster TaxID=117069 RepID=A0A9P7GWZ9_9AGAR|nr:hypothetical protein H0H81_000087 [Sphagnurus paluster]